MKPHRAGAPSDLAELQRQFQSFVLGGRDSDIVARVTPPASGSALARLDVYRDGYALRLIEALRSDYPKLAAMVGPERFDELARAYIRGRRSRSPNLRWYGEGFSRFLCGRKDRDEALVEMAAWEWDLGLAFDAPDITPIDPATLAAVPPEQWPAIRLAFHPSLRRLDLRTDAPEAWQGLESATAPEPATRSTSIPWLIWRRELEVRFRSLAEDEAWALDSALTGSDFAGLCSGLLRWREEDEVSAALVGYLHTWLRDGLSIGVSTH